MSNIEAGDFERLFSRLLDEQIRAENTINELLVRNCFEFAGITLNLRSSGSDDIFIANISKKLSGRETELKKLGPLRAQQLIFDLIYMH